MINFIGVQAQRYTAPKTLIKCKVKYNKNIINSKHPSNFLLPLQIFHFKFHVNVKLSVEYKKEQEYQQY